ncbi:MAG: glycosyltransferase family 2 protein, partial [Elusimicrobia bacterium]|nr:glycosyltransferase family 2 protein [Elusimicrobiota bacterium]
SACILTFNNEKTLEKCLESVRDFSDIVILDGGSTDRTLEIAKRYNARIYPQQEDGLSRKITDFTAMRKKLYALANEDWIFPIDSDEYLSKEGAEEAREIVENGEKNKNNLYTMLRKAIIDDKVIDRAFFYPEFCKRLWNKNANIRLKEKKMVHENMDVGEDVTIKNLNVAVYHFWSKSYRELIDKDDYYLRIAMEGKSIRPINKKLRKVIINILKAGNIFLKASRIYIRHGFRGVLPPIHSWRFVRYHLAYAKKVLFS